MNILTPGFFQRPDVTQVARELLGKVIVSNFGGERTAARIVETEAYAAWDRACHSHANRRTARTEPMFHPGGTAYVYRCYGIHLLFNISTNQEDIAEAVLIRAVEPLEGIETMLERRKMTKLEPRITAGPGILTQAMGIPLSFTREKVFGPELWIEDRGLDPEDISVGTRVGVDYAGEDAYLPFRFWITRNPYVSKAKGLEKKEAL